MGNGEVVDSMINDGLWCAFEQCHMGNSGEGVAEHYKVGRAAQDEDTARSHHTEGRARRARRATPPAPTKSWRSPFRRRKAIRSCSIATKPFAATRRPRGSPRSSR